MAPSGGLTFVSPTIDVDVDVARAVPVPVPVLELVKFASIKRDDTTYSIIGGGIGLTGKTPSMKNSYDVANCRALVLFWFLKFKFALFCMNEKSGSARELMKLPLASTWKIPDGRLTVKFPVRPVEASPCVARPLASSVPTKIGSTPLSTQRTWSPLSADRSILGRLKMPSTTMIS